MENKSIKFPDHHYVGFQARPSVDELPLGFMTPDGTDKAAVKRKSTVDTWARGYGNTQDKLPAQTFENKPMIGFKMGRNVRHGYGWGQGNVKWRIEDPRGFELEISSPNFAQVVGFCTLQEGEILEECVWARLGNENILVPVNSDVYENAVKNTERMSKSASLKDLKIGDSVVFHNGDKGIYYGAYFVTSRARDHNNGRAGHFIKCGDKKRHVFLLQSADGLSSSNYFKAMGSPKMSQVFEGTAMTHEDAEREIMRQYRENDVRLDEATNDYGKTPIAFTIEKMDSKDFQLEKVTGTLTQVSDFLVEYNKKNSYAYYGMSKAIHDAVPLFEMNDKIYTIGLQDIFSKRDYLPGGAHYNQVTAHQAAVAANPQYYRGHNARSFTELTAVEIVNDPQAENGKIMRRGSTHNRYGYSSSYHYDHESKLEVDQVPEDFFYFRQVAKSAAGTEIVCYI